MILFVDLMTGVGQAVGQFPIVRQQEKSFRIQIQTAHRPNSDTAVGHQFGHRGPPPFIGKGRHITGRLVQHDISTPFLSVHRMSIHPDIVLLRICFLSHLGDPTVHGNPPRTQQRLCCPTGADTCRR